jgi:hypothetical protein
METSSFALPSIEGFAIADFAFSRIRLLCQFFLSILRIRGQFALLNALLFSATFTASSIALPTGMCVSRTGRDSPAMITALHVRILNDPSAVSWNVSAQSAVIEAPPIGNGRDLPLTASILKIGWTWKGSVKFHIA